MLERLGETMISLTASSTSSEPASSHIRRLLTSLGEKFTCAQAAGQTRSDLLDQCCQFKEFEANVKEVHTECSNNNNNNNNNINHNRAIRLLVELVIAIRGS